VVQNPIPFIGTSDTLLEFSATASGDVSPTASLTGPAGERLTSAAVDTSGNLYLVRTYPTQAILVYAAGATGAATPVRTITGSLTSLEFPTAVAADAAGQVYVVDDSPTLPGIRVFAAGATGNVAPVQTISSPSMLYPYSIAVGGSNVYVSDLTSKSIFVFASSANGSTSPTRTITSSAAGLKSSGVAGDAAGDVYVTDAIAGSSWSIQEFAPTATGNVAPIRTITAPGGFVYGVAVDAAGTLYAVTKATTGALAIEVFGSSANGPAAPTAVISWPAWTSCVTCQIAIN
jgi:hypothetical protein